MHLNWLHCLTGRRCGLCVFVSMCWTLFRKFLISEFAYEWTAKWRACASLEQFEREKFRNTRPNSNGFSRSFKGHFGAVLSNTTRRPYWNLTDYDGVRLCLWTAATNGPTVHPPGDMWVWRAMVEWYWQEKTEELGEKPVQHKSHMDWPRHEPLLWDAGD